LLKKRRNKLIDKNIFLYEINNFSNAEKIIKKFNIRIIIFNKFFSKKNEKEELNFISYINKIKIKINNNAKLIVFSNSTYINDFCKKNKIVYYCEKNNYNNSLNFKNSNVDLVKIVDLIEGKIIEKLNFNQIIKNNKLKSYYKESSSVFVFFMGADTRTGFFNQTAGLNYKPFFTKIENGIFEMFINGSSDHLIAESIFNKIVKKNFFSEISKNVETGAKKLLSFSRSLKKKGYNNFSNKQLGLLYLKFCNLFMKMRLYSSLPTAMEHGENIWTVFLVNLLKKKIKNKEELNYVFSLFTTSSNRISYLKQFEIEIAKLGIRKGDKNFPLLIKKMIEKYSWINYTHEGSPLEKADIMERLRILGKSKEDYKKYLNEYVIQNKKIRDDKLKIIAKYKLNATEIKWLDIGSEIVFIKFFRKGVFAEAYHDVEFLFSEIAKRVGLNYKQIANMLPNEVLTALELRSFPSKLIDQRIKSSSLLHTEGKTYALSNEVGNLIEVNLKQKHNIKQLIGQTAYPGKVFGRVKIVNDIEDMKKFNKNDILVSRSTNPSLIAAMKKAAAFITDTGGLTCHAAIIAREMKIPCIVGTKFATEILKDNIFVEVDANQGKILIINK